jgi:hypothetical protein
MKTHKNVLNIFLFKKKRYESKPTYFRETLKTLREKSIFTHATSKVTDDTETFAVIVGIAKITEHT